MIYNQSSIDRRDIQNDDENCRYFWSNLGDWFAVCKRDLPWRNAPSPYEVWVSELMLQQTQVSTVLPYYERWMKRFPDIHALASSDIDDVLGAWAGLGYYRRARYLHAGAQYIASQCGGVFPSTIEALRKIPGVGDYTSGAIASFAFGQNVPAIDGNAERVFSRFFGIEGDMTRGASRKRLVELADHVAKLGDAANINQAVMDLGASLCSRVAQCNLCPLADRCHAQIYGKTESLPQKSKRIEKTGEYYIALMLTDGDSCLMARRSSGALLGGLWQFPMVRVARTKVSDIRACAESARDTNIHLARHRLFEYFGYISMIDDINIESLPQNVEHIFTHIHMIVRLDRAYISPAKRDALPSALDTVVPTTPTQEFPYDAYTWTSCANIGKKYAISSLMKKLHGMATKRPY